MRTLAGFKRIGVCGLGGGFRLPRDLAFFVSYHMPKTLLILVDGGIYKPHHIDHEHFLVPGNKARVSADYIKRDFPEIRTQPVSKYVAETETSQTVSVDHLVLSGDCWFLQLDNNRTKALFDKRARQLSDITLISGGTNNDQLKVQAYVRRRGKDITPPISAYCDEIAAPKDKSPADLLETRGCVEEIGRRPGFHPFTMLAASTMLLNAFYAIRKLESLGRLSDINYDELWFDVVSGRCRTEKHPVK